MPHHTVAHKRNPEVALDERDEPGLSGGEDDPPPVPPECPTPSEFTIVVADDLSLAPDMAWLGNHLTQALSHISGEHPVLHLDISIVGDEAMITLHAQHQGIEETTDVLTFPMSEPGEEVEISLMICADEAKRQAERRGHAIEKELLLYIIHGVLHCLGFDDHNDKDFQRIHAEEDRILEAIGVGRVFAGDEMGDEAV